MTASLAPRGLELRPETPSVTTFEFRIDEQPDYVPGQIIMLKIEDLGDSRDSKRPFTLSSSPTEAGCVSITTKMTDSRFKNTLLEIAKAGNDVSERLTLEGPEGDFIRNPKRPAVMIAGGIGITPFRSMIRHAADSGNDTPVTLLYSNDSPDEIAFREELDRLAKEHDWLTVIHTITGDTDDWSGRAGRIDADLIAGYGEQLDKPVYYVCGPPAMVKAMDNVLQDELDIAKADRRSEKFSGY